MLTLCTLFDHNYLDKGLVMYESLERCCKDFELYVLAMSDECYNILTDLNCDHIKPIRLSDFEDDELLKIKPERKIGEYCWTCSSSLVRYILMNFHPEYCSYIDSDLYFYSDPQKIIDEMKSKDASVQVIGHRFNKWESDEGERIVGKYCVEFNTFKNDKNGLFLVNLWRNQCLKHCSLDGDGVYWGDQKYLDKWCEDYDFVIETENLGAGVAPWNINQYKLIKQSDNKLLCNGKDVDLCFYHFENIEYISRNVININVYSYWGIDDSLVDYLYLNYLAIIDKYKSLLKEKYGIDVLLLKHPGVDLYRPTLNDKLRFFANMIINSKSRVSWFYKTVPSKLFSSKNIFKI